MRGTSVISDSSLSARSSLASSSMVVTGVGPTTRAISSKTMLCSVQCCCDGVRRVPLGRVVEMVLRCERALSVERSALE
jgi:hypothetical protein